jgi:2-polyprenyl-6-methoxyphenol hydroxylase-like FAD-dependent oxidoreductase
MLTRLVIVGGGIGGLATALATARHGHEVVVLERQPEFNELGAGIQLAPNAFGALDRLGVGEKVRERAVFVEQLRLMDGINGQLIVRMDLRGEFRHRFDKPYAVVHRLDMYEPLLRACHQVESITLHHGCPVQRYERDGTGVAAVLESGERGCGTALIGADGLRSRIRSQLIGDGSPRMSGHTIYRSVIPMEDMPKELRLNAATLWMGPGFHVVHYPIAGGKSCNIVAIVDNGARQEVAGLPVQRGEVLDAFAGVRSKVRVLLERGRDWRSWALYDRDPVPKWSDGPVTLLGDAAHPMLPFTAQGAAMALEDAVCLGDVLHDERNFVDAFARFSALRTERTGQVQLISRMMSDRIYHLAGDQAVERNAVLSALSQTELLDKIDWLWRY